jgi:PAS domain S-box-containing protein
MGISTASELPRVRPKALGDSEADGLRARIRCALAGDAFTMVYQPVVDIRTGQIVGAEALARFNIEPLRTPDLWFGEAWSVGIGMELEIEAIGRALAQLDRMPPGTYIAVNAAPATLCSEALLGVLADFPLDRVVIEITEHARVEDYEALNTAIARLRAGGARLSIDDAGAGFSSFQHVLRLRPDIIKLDRSLTMNVDSNPVRSALASALVTFAASLGARICAEGIETPGELVALQKLGVAFGQGYLLARPAALPLAEIPVGIWTSRRTKSSAGGGFVASPAVRSSDRLDALERTGLMDSDREEDFDRLTKLTARLLGVPVALVSLVEDQRQFFKSTAGMGETPARETPLEYSFCQHAVTTRLPLIIDDAREHPLVRDSGAVTQFGVVAYAGVPLLTWDDHALGTLCAIDVSPRAWSAEDVSLLCDLALTVVAQIELRQARRERRDQHEVFRRVFDQMNACVLLCSIDGRVEHASTRFCDLVGYTETELCGRSDMALEHPDDLIDALSSRSELLTGIRNEACLRKRFLCKDGGRFETIATTSVVRDTAGKAMFTISTMNPAPR